LKFLRENISGKAAIKNISDLVAGVEFEASHNFIDHAMGRTSVMSVRSKTDAVRVATDLNMAADLKAKVGANYSVMTHYEDGMPGTYIFVPDAEFKNIGIFGELNKNLSNKESIISGLRMDRWTANDNERAVMMMSLPASSTKGQSRSDSLFSGFGRYENVLSSIPNAKAYIGFGRSERMPDYWELISASSRTSQQFLTLKTEKTNQLDIGVIQKTDSSFISASLFYNKIKDYVMIAYSNGSSTGVNNIDATTYGGELSAVKYVMPKWKLGTSIAYTHGKNDTTNTTLAQVAPLEGKVSLNYEEGQFTHGGVLRLVAAKNKYDENNGGIAGYDLGKTGGFGIFSLNTTYKYDKRTSLSAGVDNLFDKSYAEFISRKSSTITGYAPSVRVNEPGRTAWLKATIALD
jgi:iron complex outermembrane receptor protein